MWRTLEHAHDGAGLVRAARGAAELRGDPAEVVALEVEPAHVVLE